MRKENDWTRTINDDVRKPYFETPTGWALYKWIGLSFKWVLCTPEGTKIGYLDGSKTEDEAKTWANRCLMLLRGETET